MTLPPLDFVTGGFAVLLAGMAIGYLRAAPSRVYGYVRSRFVFSVEVLQGDDAFVWLIRWLHQHPSVQRSKRLAIATHHVDGKLEVTYTPLGTHVLRRQGRLVWFDRNRERQKGEGGLFAGMFETLTVSTLSRRRGFLEELLIEAQASYEAGRRGQVAIWSLSQYGDWLEIARRDPRPIESVVLPRAVIDRTLGDVRTFEARRDWYHSIGVPYRRGYLLHGQPGNGKSSLVLAIASELGRDIGIVSLGSPSLTDDMLRAGLARLPGNAVLLIEDIDGVFVGRKPVRDDMKLTFSGLLNALDGVATPEGRIMFVTTNYLERLDAALIRPGRMDVQVAIDPPGRPEIAELHRRFFGDLPVALPPAGESMASYQERFLREIEVAA